MGSAVPALPQHQHSAEIESCPCFPVCEDLQSRTPVVQCQLQGIADLAIQDTRPPIPRCCLPGGPSSSIMSPSIGACAPLEKTSQNTKALGSHRFCGGVMDIVELPSHSCCCANTENHSSQCQEDPSPPQQVLWHPSPPSHPGPTQSNAMTTNKDTTLSTARHQLSCC